MTLPLLVAAVAFAASTPPPSNGCTAAESHQFDFWIGDWNVIDPAGKVAGHNRIESILGGCVLSENWDGAAGGRGKSYNAYDTTAKVWRQFWVDARGGVLQLEGGLVGKDMVLRSTRPGARVDRITWTPNGDGTVRQHWESSDDGGKTWKTEFDGRYERTRSGPAGKSSD
ncbi:MAG TPA: hypothetical protein VKB52_12230 [Rhodanobacteraceae bacterium]|nr:hypothetical protein [Rhodanobacteraceae bacterium]